MSKRNKIVQEEICPGITLVAEKLPNFYSFSLGLFINHGSRDERAADNGITHLIEHMLFKGTSRRSSLEIVKMIEGLGGSFDAFTTKENLVILTKFLSEHLNRVFSLILEILLESKFASRDLTKEKSVVREEIKTDEDDPGDYVFELLFKDLFPGHSLAWPIAGTQDSVGAISPDRIRDYYRRILSQKVVIAVSGDFKLNRLVSQIRQHFYARHFQEQQRLPPSLGQPAVTVQKKKEISQVHVLFGLPTAAYDSPLRRPLLLLNSALGGSMSSRLFQGLRETAGLVYDVHSFIDFYSDCGVFGFYLVCDRRKLKAIAGQMRRIFRAIRRDGFTREEIELAKTFNTGNLLLSLESTTNRMMRLGREMMYLKRIYSVEELVNSIRALKTDDINRLIPDYLDLARYSVAAIGPVSRTDIVSFHADASS